MTDRNGTMKFYELDVQLNADGGEFKPSNQRGRAQPALRHGVSDDDSISAKLFWTLLKMFFWQLSITEMFSIGGLALGVLLCIVSSALFWYLGLGLLGLYLHRMQRWVV